MASMFAYRLQFKTESYMQAICQNHHTNVYTGACREVRLRKILAINSC